MNNTFTKVMNPPRHRQRYAISGGLCTLIIGASIVTGCKQNDDVSLPPIKQTSSVKTPKLGSVKVAEPTVAELEAQLVKIRSDPKLDAGKRSMGIGMIEGQIKELKNRQKP